MAKNLSKCVCEGVFGWRGCEVGLIPKFLKISGAKRVREHQSLLIDLAARCGQDGAMDQLDYHLSWGQARAKVPHLLLYSEMGSHVEAAVLLYEYCLKGFPTRIFIPSDFAGERTILAPEEMRYVIARQAAEYFLKRGAFVVLLSTRCGDLSFAEGPNQVDVHSGYLYASRTRPVRRLLRLEGTYGATLAKMGKGTRRSLRQQAFRIGESFGAKFIAEPDISEADFLYLNQHSAFPMSKSVALWRIRTVRRLANGVFFGLRAADGRWLSILGGRRQGKLTDVDWQSNLSGMYRCSVVSAMRAHVMEHEIKLGVAYLRFENGTSHPMQQYFEDEAVSDLLMVQPLLGERLVRRLLPRLLPSDNLLSGVLRGFELNWRSGQRLQSPDAGLSGPAGGA